MNTPIIDEPNQFVSSSKSVGGTIRGAYQSVNPFDGKILKTFDQLTDKQLETALATAAICFEA